MQGKPQDADPHRASSTDTIVELQTEFRMQQTVAEIHLKNVEKRFKESIVGLEDKNKYYEKEIEKLRRETFVRNL